MTCATCASIRRPPRRAPTRAPHLCRGRGGRGCRCHVAARPRLARPVLAGDGHPLRWRPTPGEGPPRQPGLNHVPQHPQAPPHPV
ncbi:hypothetical protein EQ718_03720 [Paracoccus versutus]|uniref:Uncharacterized protein n=1 Tax=Paracoccus versutus TaxID=34007 RepID=A0AAQ0HMJ9_PARVE|nr:hypothetical protein [Paracoccus versutus]KGJ12264.1 hypothetical protein IT40_03040 [Paracoccus versutus]REG57201.1 hypothetical protein ATH84_1001249 [Paracoccus versutus]WEJ78043.1 hypothetical protein EQ718_03720 [Paracoccus versutus]